MINESAATMNWRNLKKRNISQKENKLNPLTGNKDRLLFEIKFFFQKFFWETEIVDLEVKYAAFYQIK